MKVIGLMSGTSLDGIDAALVHIENQNDSLHLQLLGFVTLPLPGVARESLRAILPPHGGTIEKLCALNFEIGEAFAKAAAHVAAAYRIPLSDVDLIASHGQTVFHRQQPPRSTLQIGEPAIIADRSGCTVVSNFRPRDMAAGGQGAPLVPWFDALLFRHQTQHRVLLNIGGMANLTYLSPSGQTIAFDTGPGNVLIDEAMRILTNGKQSFDNSGDSAAQGRANAALATEWLSHPFFELPPPKSTGRELFNSQMAQAFVGQCRRAGLQNNDILATLTHFTAASIALGTRRFLPSPDEIFVAGGGARNRTLLAQLSNALQDPSGRPRWRSTNEIGLPADAKEAIAFAAMGYATLHNWPANLKAATGARHPVVLGNVTPGANYHRLMEHVAKSASPTPQRILWRN